MRNGHLFRRSLASLRRGQGFDVENPCWGWQPCVCCCEKRIVPQRFLPQPFLFHEMALIEPAEMSATCLGILGRYSCATRLPLGRIKARYSPPPEESSGTGEIADPVRAAFFPEAQTYKSSPMVDESRGRTIFCNLKLVGQRPAFQRLSLLTGIGTQPTSTVDHGRRMDWLEIPNEQIWFSKSAKIGRESRAQHHASDEHGR